MLFRYKVRYFIIKSSYFYDASKKLLFQVADFYLNVFSLDRPLVYVLFILPYFIIPGVLISCWRPEKGTSSSHITPLKEILQQVKAVPQIIPQKLLNLLKAFLTICRKGKLHDTNVHSQHSLCGHDQLCVIMDCCIDAIFCSSSRTASIFSYFICISYMHHKILTLFLPDEGNFQIYSQTPSL